MHFKSEPSVYFSGMVAWSPDILNAHQLTNPNVHTIYHASTQGASRCPGYYFWSQLHLSSVGLLRSEASGLISGIVGTVVAWYFEWSISCLWYNVTCNANTPEMRPDTSNFTVFVCSASSYHAGIAVMLPCWHSCHVLSYLPCWHSWHSCHSCHSCDGCELICTTISPEISTCILPANLIIKIIRSCF